MVHHAQWTIVVVYELSKWLDRGSGMEVGEKMTTGTGTTYLRACAHVAASRSGNYSSMFAIREACSARSSRPCRDI